MKTCWKNSTDIQRGSANSICCFVAAYAVSFSQHRTDRRTESRKWQKCSCRFGDVRMSQKSVFLAQSTILQKYLCHYGSTRKLLIQLDEKQFLCPSTGEKRKSTANGREYAAYRERYYNAAEGMSHTVTSRELCISSLRFKSSTRAAFISLGTVVPNTL